mgnify:CR=1 FL=1
MQTHNFLNHLPYVELLDVFAKLASFDLSKIEEILDEKAHHGRWSFLDFLALLEFLNYFVYLWKTEAVRNLILSNLNDLFVKGLFLNVDGTNGVQRISELVGDAGIDHGQQVVLDFLLVAQDA